MDERMVIRINCQQCERQRRQRDDDSGEFLYGVSRLSFTGKTVPTVTA